MSRCGYGTDEKGVVLRVEPIDFEKYFMHAGIVAKRHCDGLH